MCSSRAPAGRKVKREPLLSRMSLWVVDITQVMQGDDRTQMPERHNMCRHEEEIRRGRLHLPGQPGMSPQSLGDELAHLNVRRKRDFGKLVYIDPPLSR